MNSRLNIQDVALLLAERVGRDKAETELFLRALVEEVTEGVCADRQVRVKGLGTFKVILVEERESVHVNTGERFLIPAHPKFTFLPDKELREQVNRPFSIFETTELNDGVAFSDMEEKAESVKLESAEEPQDTAIPPQEETKPVAGQAEPMKAPVAAAPVVETQPTTVVKPAEAIASSKREWWILLVAICGLMAVVATVFFYLGRNNWHPAPTTPAEGQPQEHPQPIDPFPTDSLSAAPIDSAIIEPDTIVSAKPSPWGEERIQRGDKLTEIALKYYGSKLFWVYIYQHNKAVIQDPNNVPIGTRIELPAPELYGIDANSRASREKAAALQTEILTKE